MGAAAAAAEQTATSRVYKVDIQSQQAHGVARQLGRTSIAAACRCDHRFQGLHIVARRVQLLLQRLQQRVRVVAAHRAKQQTTKRGRHAKARVSTGGRTQPACSSKAFPHLRHGTDGPFSTRCPAADGWSLAQLQKGQGDGHSAGGAAAGGWGERSGQRRAADGAQISCHVSGQQAGRQGSAATAAPRRHGACRPLASPDAALGRSAASDHSTGHSKGTCRRAHGVWSLLAACRAGQEFCACGDRDRAVSSHRSLSWALLAEAAWHRSWGGLLGASARPPC